MPTLNRIAPLLFVMLSACGTPLTHTTRVESPNRDEWYYVIDYHGAKLNALERARLVCGALAYEVVDQAPHEITVRCHQVRR